MKAIDKLPLVAARMLDEHGFHYVCYEQDEELHYAQKPVVHTPRLTQEQIDLGYMPVPERRFAVVRFADEDVDNGNLQFFLERGYTR